MNKLIRMYDAMCLKPGMALWFLGLMCIAPFLVKHHMQPLTSFFSEWLAFALGLAAAFTLLRRDVWQSMRLPIAVLIPLGLMGVVLIQALMGLITYPQQAVLVALYLLWAALLILLGATLRRELGIEKVARVLAFALLIGGLSSAVIVFCQVAGLNPFNLVARKAGYYSNLAQVNHLANYLALALASLLYLYAREYLNKCKFFGLVSVLLVALALTGQRSCWLYLIAMLILGFVTKYRFPGLPSLKLWEGALWSIFVFSLAQLLLPYFPVTSDLVTPAERLANMAGEPSMRLEFWRMAWEIFTHHPLLGVGFYQYNWENFLLAEYGHRPLGSIGNAHNLFMHLLAETGLMGTGVVLSGLIYWLYRALKTPLTPEHWWVLALLGVLFLHSMIEFPLWYAYFLGVAAIALGMQEQKEIQAKLDLGPLALAGVMAFGVLSLTNTAYHYTHMESWIAWVQQGRATKAQWEAIRQGLVAMRNRSLLTPQVDMLIVVSMPLDRSHLADKLALSDTVMRVTPDDSVSFRHVRLLALAGHKEESLKILGHAMIRYPRKIEGFVISLLPLMNREPAILPILNAAMKRLYLQRQQDAAQKQKI